jgi:4-hydroxy-3-methylbut-2-en-1-yl diphosphate synthase IspG/GcpE
MSCVSVGRSEIDHTEEGRTSFKEMAHASLGISLPRTFEEPKAPVYVDGRVFTTLKGDHIVAEFIKILDEYVESHYAAKEEVAAR